MLLRKTIHARQVSRLLNRPPNNRRSLIAWMMSICFLNAAFSQSLHDLAPGPQGRKISN